MNKAGKDSSRMEAAELRVGRMRRTIMHRFALSLLLLAAALVATQASTASAEAATDCGTVAVASPGPNSLYDFSDKVLDVRNWSTANTATVWMWQYRTTGNVNNQRWRVLCNTDGSVTFQNINSGKCLDESAPRNGGTVYQYTCHFRFNQRWILDPSNNGFDRLVNEEDYRCLDIKSYSWYDGAAIQVYACHSRSATPEQLWNQNWYFR
jgi:Ricin-type beta-trefoil lectin domain-like